MKRLILVPLLLFVACASPQAQMESWMGKSEGDLIQAWGPPQNRESDGKGGQVLTYGKTVDLGQTPGYMQRNYNGTVSWVNPEQNSYTRIRQFYINPEGTIYYFRWQGY